MVEKVGRLEISMRAYFSAYHLWAAGHFARLANDIENAHTGRAVFDISHRAYVTNAIFSAVAFLEAAINELFEDAVDNHPSYLDALTPERRQRLCKRWSGKDSVERRSMLKI